MPVLLLRKYRIFIRFFVHCEKIFFPLLTIPQKESTLAPSSKEQTNDADE